MFLLEYINAMDIKENFLKNGNIRILNSLNIIRFSLSNLVQALCIVLS